MLIKKKSTDGTVNNTTADTRIKAEKQEVISAVAKAGKRYNRMLSRLSK